METRTDDNLVVIHANHFIWDYNLDQCIYKFI